MTLCGEFEMPELQDIGTKIWNSSEKGVYRMLQANVLLRPSTKT